MTTKKRKPTIGIRREDKSIWERRVPLIPEHASELVDDHDITVIVQPSDIRVFHEEEYIAVGAEVREDLSDCDAIFAVKEVPPNLLLPDKTYVYFAHVVKGQPYNMPMLRRLLDLGCTLIDYEKVTDDKGRRLIFFGRHAGWAGMLDTLWALGQRLQWEGFDTPFSTIRQAHAYETLAAAKEAVQKAGAQIRAQGLPHDLTPLVVGFAGYGNVSQGAQDIFDLLPFEEVEPAAVAELFERESDSHTLYKVVFKERHMVEPLSPEHSFELQDYYKHPEKYRSRFPDYLPYLTVLVNGIYWESRYPRLVTKVLLRDLFGSPTPPRLRVIGDISCDVEGAVECTVRCTEPGDPIYVYDPLTGRTADGHAGEGVVVLAVDILPSELPREASTYFSGVLKEFIPAIVQANHTLSFDDLDLPPETKRAVIAFRGELTPDYRYLQKHLKDA
jgi:saccharopine dehydrogenase (NAD+, L-lysine-forming)